jgi:hypothetical protein
VLAGGFLQPLFPCNTTKLFTESKTLRHILGFFTLIFFVVVSDTEIDDYMPLGTILLVSALIYAWFLFASKMTANWWLVLVALLGGLYLIDLYETRQKKEDPVVAGNLATAKKVILGASLFITAIGFLIFGIDDVFFDMQFLRYLRGRRNNRPVSLERLKNEPEKLIAIFIPAWMEGGVMANLEATRYALGRKNQIAIEINGSKGSLVFDFEDMNKLKFYNGNDPKDRQGFRDILVTQRDGIQPYVANWWPPGHGLGYEHTFVHAVADFVNACADGKSVQPTFEDGLKNQRVLTAVEESSAKGKWVKL